MKASPPNLQEGGLGRAVVVLDDIDSTNAEAMRRATAGETGPLWVMARRQTRGRGRSGRAWVSEVGNLYASLLVTLDCPPANAHQLSLLAGVGVLNAIHAVAGGELDLRLKWPNDVLIGAAKCAGILPESISGASRGLIAVIGVGINLAHAPADLGRAATCLSEHGIAVRPGAVLSALDAAMGRWLDIWRCGDNFEAVRTAWLARATAEGETIAVNAGEGRIEGCFAGVDESGALLLMDRLGEVRRFTYGDVALAVVGTAGVRR